jgi:hypothetical protein
MYNITFKDGNNSLIIEKFENLSTNPFKIGDKFLLEIENVRQNNLLIEIYGEKEIELIDEVIILHINFSKQTSFSVIYTFTII